MLPSSHTHRASLDLGLKVEVDFLYTPAVPTSNEDPGSAAEITRRGVMITTPDGLEHLAPTWLADLIISDLRGDLESEAEEDRAEFQIRQRAA